MTKPRTCPECGTTFTAPPKKGKPRLFCCDEHKSAWKSRKLQRGQMLVTLAQAWRKTRGSGEFGKFLFGEVSSLLDEWNNEDAAKKRMDPVDYAKLVCNFEEINPDYNNGKTFWADRWMDRNRPKQKKPEREPKVDPTLEVLRLIEAGHNNPRELIRERLGSLPADNS